MSILVTGGAGFIGSHLCQRLLAEGREVICIDNFDPFYDADLKRKNIAAMRQDENFQFEKMDVRSDKLAGFMKDGNVEKVVHLAARPGVLPSLQNPKIYEEINVGGTLNVLEACRKNNIENLVFISSSSVYGNCAQIPWKEEYPPLPASPYGASKLAGEAYVLSYSQLYSQNASCLRYFSIYGPRQRPDLAIAKFTKAILGGSPINMFGDGSSLRDYTYISDAVDGTSLALNKKFRFEIFNIGDSNPIQLKRLIKLLEQNLNKAAIINHQPAQMGDLPNTYADISKSQKMLGYSPKVKIEAGIKMYLDWHMGGKNT